MAIILSHVSAGSHRKTIFTRAEIIKRVRTERENAESIEVLKRTFQKAQPIHRRVANVRKFKGGYKVVGIASLLDLTANELRASLKQRGFNGIRSGCVVTNL